MNHSDKVLRQGQMELLLRWEGRLNNARVRELFDLSQVRASEWIREFRDSNPTWTEWDSKARSFYPTVTFQKHRHEGGGQLFDQEYSLSRYLVLAGIPHGGDRAEASRIVWAAYPDLSVPDPSIFSAVLTAARERRLAEITYRSMRQPVAHRRLISPHSIVRAGRRWHVRAYCSESQLFKDFSLGRIDSVKLLVDQRAEGDESDDHEWNELVQLKLVAHPALSQDQARLIEAEYFDGKKALKQSCRQALVNYVIQDLRAATNVDIQHPPDFQIAVANVKDLAKWLFPA
jgi:hypothetical protein